MLGEARLLAGDVEEAGRRGDEAIALALAVPDVAHARFEEAISLAGARGMRPLIAHGRLGLGHARALDHDRSGARTEITAALADYRAMAMPYWIARAADALATLG
ncbi:MAG: hypothetical protein FJZ38_06605 [Candidatus Rokubacteria bacterium]|nr:hypothetical protein [Candidatus Rokubacteria bacterium]